jgi:hypothetical protein
LQTYLWSEHNSNYYFLCLQFFGGCLIILNLKKLNVNCNYWWNVFKVFLFQKIREKCSTNWYFSRDSLSNKKICNSHLTNFYTTRWKWLVITHTSFQYCNINYCCKKTYNVWPWRSNICAASHLLITLLMSLFWQTRPYIINLFTAVINFVA